MLKLRSIVSRIWKPISGPAQGAERSAGWYDAAFQSDDRWRRHYSESRYFILWSSIVRQISEAGCTSILDIGCGPGQVATMFRDQGFPRYLGIDFSPERIAFARKICPDYEFVVEDVLTTDLFTTHRYDAVVCSELLEHLDHDLELIDRIPAKSFFCGSVPNFAFPSHVRYFKDADEIEHRYGRFFSEFSIEPLEIENSDKVYYLFQGRKR